MISWQEDDVQTNGINLHYYRCSSSGPPIILLHGITDNGMCWPYVSEALADQYELIGVDARGHGKSEKPEGGASYVRTEHAKDVAGLIEALGLTKPAVIGHSMGSGTASTLAANYPDMVGALVLEDPPWREKRDDSEMRTHAEQWTQQIARRKEMTRDALRAQGVSDNPLWQDREFENWVDAKYQVSPNVIGYIDPSEMTWEEVVTKIPCPTLLITADPKLNAIVTPEIATKAQKLNEQVDVANVPLAGHNIRRENFSAYIDAVKQFLKQHYPA